jgi:hypothetical protein
MARIRTIKPHFFRSYDVAALSYRARLTWIGLWTYVDDEGRGRDDARIIKGELWALEDDVTWKDIQGDLTELSRSAHVTRYTVDGRDYLAIPTWDEHQVISRPTASKFPAPNPANIRDREAITEDSRSTHGVNSAGKGTGNREREQGKGKGTVAEATDSFKTFWDLWPRNEGKADAVKAWAKATRMESPEVILAAASTYANHPHRPAKQFVPHGATWLNGERWNDGEPTATENTRPSKADEVIDVLEQGRRMQAEHERRAINS